MRTTRQIAELIVGRADITPETERDRLIAMRAAQLAYQEVSQHLIEAAADLHGPHPKDNWNVEYTRGQVELIANTGLPNPVGIQGLDHEEKKHLIESLILQTAEENDL